MAAGEQFEKLIEILAILRGPGGCPWDREQTYKDINPYLIEEAHEVVESIDRSNFSELAEELGDLLVHILFHCQIASEEKKFDAGQVAVKAVEKLVRRHPHVFGDKKLRTTEQVLHQWERIKQEERKKDSILEGLPKALPALIKAFRLGEKASRVGFDWPNQQGVLGKIDEELRELKSSLTSGVQGEIEHEYGDLLLAMANLGRFVKLDPESALRKSAHRFIKRFQWIESQARQKQKRLQDFTTEEWDALWEEAKMSIAHSLS